MSTVSSEGAGKTPSAAAATHGGEFCKVDVDVKVPLLVQGAKAILWLASWGVAIWWISLWFRLPAAEGKRFKRHVSTAVASTFWGKYCTPKLPNPINHNSILTQFYRNSKVHSIVFPFLSR